MTVNTTYPMSVRNSVTNSSLSQQLHADADSAVNAFLAEAKKSPMERIKEAILRKHGITEAQFEQLPAEKQALIQREIEETMKQKMNGAKADAPATGMNANVLA